MAHRVVLHQAAFTELATSAEVYAVMFKYMSAIKAHAAMSAPRATGQYAASFRIAMGRKDNRAVGYVLSDHPAAAQIEWGVPNTSGRAWYGPTPAHHTMAASFWAAAPEDTK